MQGRLHTVQRASRKARNCSKCDQIADHLGRVHCIPCDAEINGVVRASLKIDEYIYILRYLMSKFSTNKKEKNNEILYPWGLCKFDENFLRFNGEFISDEKIISSIRVKSILAKMLWESKRNFILSWDREKINYFLKEELIDIKNKKIASSDFLPNLCMSIEFAKIISSNSRINRYVHLSLDRKIIFKYFTESVEQLRFDISSSGISWDFSCFHPYVQAVLEKNDIELLKFIRTEEYKNHENNFIGVSNAENRKLRNLFFENLIVNRNIFILRFDISIDSLVIHNGADLREIREGLDIAVGRLRAHFAKNLLSVIDVIFPSVLAIKNKERITDLCGHLLLIFSGISKREQSAISEYTLQTVYGTPIGLGSMDLTVPSQKNSASGALRLSDPKSLPALTKAAAFLTIERRFIRPRELPGEYGRLVRPHTLRIKTF